MCEARTIAEGAPSAFKLASNICGTAATTAASTAEAFTATGTRGFPVYHSSFRSRGHEMLWSRLKVYGGGSVLLISTERKSARSMFSLHSAHREQTCQYLEI